MSHHNTHHITCPHCGHVWRDGWELGLRDEETEEMECSKCEKPFSVTLHISISYSTEAKGQANDHA